MPCRRCGESAREKHAGACVGLETVDGEARYFCLDCVIEKMKNASD